MSISSDSFRVMILIQAEVNKYAELVWNLLVYQYHEVLDEQCTRDEQVLTYECD